MDKIIVINITIDAITRSPAYVIIGIFNQKGAQQMSFTWPGKLFSDNIKIGDELILITKPKEGETAFIQG